MRTAASAHCPGETIVKFDQMSTLTAQDRTKGESAAEMLAQELSRMFLRGGVADGGPQVSMMPVLDTLEHLARCPPRLYSLTLGCLAAVCGH